jgi:L-lactate dehydrogenase complex protein LldE
MTDTATTAPPTVGKPRVGLFATSLIDLFRPRVGFAAVKLLEDAGCSVEVPSTQTCCGQPALNSGDFADTRDIARQVIETFVGYDYVVGPSGSCMATIKNDYPQLFADDVEWRLKAQDLSRRSYELLSFLTDVLGVREVTASFSATATYHDSCSGLRGLGIKAQPRALLARGSRSSKWMTRTCAAASAVPSASNTPTSRKRSLPTG